MSYIRSKVLHKRHFVWFYQKSRNSISNIKDNVQSFHRVLKLLTVLLIPTSLGSLAISIEPSAAYLMGDPPSWTRVPYAVGVKNAATPAPPALNLSAKVP